MKERQYSAKIILDTYENGNRALRIDTDGIVTFRGVGVFVDFQNEDYKTTIGFSEDTVTLTRIGEQSYTIILTKNQVKEFFIDTGYGLLPIKVTTHDISYKQEDNIINLVMEYSLKADALTESMKNKLILKCVFGGAL
ncbi:MAG TPA: DUF1934 domain-containing protein [Clostridia bacterium]